MCPRIPKYTLLIRNKVQYNLCKIDFLNSMKIFLNKLWVVKIFFTKRRNPTQLPAPNFDKCLLNKLTIELKL
jgi:hypothetical protein